MSRRVGGNQANGSRHPTDLYPTDPRWTQALLDSTDLRGPVWECAAGNDDMARVLLEAGHEVRTTDILTGQDFLAFNEPWLGSIVTNPPYRLADEFVHHALDLACEQVAMLLPIGYLGGQRRYTSTWSIRPPALVLVVASRMPVNGSASQFNHVWAVWDQRHYGPTQIRWAR